MVISFQDLLKKYDVQVPRYTSYPTVPSWTRTPSSEEWLSEISHSLASDEASWALYIHIPFCETLCTFCGCNTIITKNHSQESSYVDLLLKEFDLYLKSVPELHSRPLRQIHLGGGTPTFLSPHHLRQLVDGIFSKVKKVPHHFEASLEVDPRRTTRDQLETLRQVGFDRISLGVQDFNEKVQLLINRHQPFEQTAEITNISRELGYHSVNFDLIYGLPQQDLESMKHTVEMTLKLRPDRIALYSFALVPWIKPAQRLFQDHDLPPTDKKRELYEEARALFLKAGYVEIGMDHFALPTDSMVKAQKQGQLHRNFMGYTDFKTDLLLGLGVSSISESHSMFHQNEKLLPKFTESLEKGILATHRGHVLNSEDQIVRQRILMLMTRFQLDVPSESEAQKLKARMQTLEDDGLIEWSKNTVSITSSGRPFIRNICSFIDEHLQANQAALAASKANLFSKSI